jgi:LPS export ABC transporter protein LptC
MSGSGRWVLIGLVIAIIPLVIWALLQAPATAPGRRGAASGPVAPPTPARPSPSPTPARIPPVQVEHTAISTVDEGGRPQWDIHAESVTVDGVRGTAALTTVEGTYFQAGQPSVIFMAPRGTFYITSRNVILTGGVRARASSGRTLEADEVKWFPKTKQIEATGSVVLRQKGLTAWADRVTADASLEHYKLSGNVRVQASE